MNISQYRKFDTANGPGIRATIFVSGCTHNCKGCFNKKYFDFNYGNKYNQDVKQSIINDINTSPIIKGVTILGGEPFQQDDDLIDLLKAIKEINTEIWIYSGYTFDEIISDVNKLKILELCDVLVDGKFEENKKNLNLRFRGSENQCIIDIKKSLERDYLTLLEGYN